MPRQTSLWNEGLVAQAGYIETWARGQGLWPVLGVDEVGRGCLAGPVVAAALILPEPWDIGGLTDSKLLTPARREDLAILVRGRALALGIGWAEAEEVDRVGVLSATLAAMRRAVEGALNSSCTEVGLVVVDGISPIPGLPWPQKTWVRADRLSLNCAGASIVAKVERDRFMVECDARYPGYGFSKHKGYATTAHREALARLGPCPLHRRSFAPLRCREVCQKASSITRTVGVESSQVTTATKKRTSS